MNKKREIIKYVIKFDVRSHVAQEPQEIQKIRHADLTNTVIMLTVITVTVIIIIIMIMIITMTILVISIRILMLIIYIFVIINNSLVS